MPARRPPAGVDAVRPGPRERLAVAVSGTACPAATAFRIAGHLDLPVQLIAARHQPLLPRLADGAPDHGAIAADVEPGDDPRPAVPGAARRWSFFKRLNGSGAGRLP